MHFVLYFYTALLGLTKQSMDLLRISDNLLSLTLQEIVGWSSGSVELVVPVYGEVQHGGGVGGPRPGPAGAASPLSLVLRAGVQHRVPYAPHGGAGQGRELDQLRGRGQFEAVR